MVRGELWDMWARASKGGLRWVIDLRSPFKQRIIWVRTVVDVFVSDYMQQVTKAIAIPAYFPLLNLQTKNIVAKNFADAIPSLWIAQRPYPQRIILAVQMCTDECFPGIPPVPRFPFSREWT